MPVDIGEAIQEGVERTIARNGLYLVVITFVLDAVGALVSNDVAREVWIGAPQDVPIQRPPTGPSLGLSPTVAGLLSLVVSIVSLIVVIAAIRTFVSDETETIPGEHFSHNVVLALVNLIVGGIVFGIVLAVGFVLFVIPGLFLLVSLLFWNVYVIVEDQNFIEGFRNSWGLTSGHRLRLFLLGVVVVVIGIVIGIVFGIPRAFLPRSIGFLVAQIGSAFSGVFVLATIARTYEQLVAEEEAAESGPASQPDEGSEFEFGDDSP